MTCVHFLDLAIAIQRERDTAKRLQLLRDLPDCARDAVLAWLWADLERSRKDASRDLCDALIEADESEV